MLLIFALAAFTGLAPTGAYGIEPCSLGLKEPPFLAFGVDPNLLLLIDNSGSMIDMAYVETNSQCFDDAYDPATTYAGYFFPSTSVMYVYNLASEKFELYTAANESQYTSAGGTAYYQDNPGDVWIKIDATPSLTGLVASGNFLNWTTASKIDIQKEILTGGKYDDTNNLLIMESRGCSGQRHVKKIQFQHYNDGSAHDEINYLTLAIRPAKSPIFALWENIHAYSHFFLKPHNGTFKFYRIWRRLQNNHLFLSYFYTCT